MVHIFYYETFYLFSSSISWIYNKEKCERVNVVLLYKSVMDLNAFLFKSNIPKIGHIQVKQAKYVSTYVPSSIPVSMAREDQKLHQTSIFDLTIL